MSKKAKWVSLSNLEATRLELGRRNDDEDDGGLDTHAIFEGGDRSLTFCFFFFMFFFLGIGTVTRVCFSLVGGPGFVLLSWGTSILIFFFFSTAIFFLFQIWGGPWPQPVPPSSVSGWVVWVLLGGCF
jgi:hypothetical protein